MGEGIANLPASIANVFIDLFTVEDDYFSNKLSYYQSKVFEKLGVDTSLVSQLENIGSSDIVDITGTYNGKTVTFVDFSIWQKYSNFFKGVINGFLKILLVFVNLRQVLWIVRGTSPVSEQPSQGGDSK